MKVTFPLDSKADTEFCKIGFLHLICLISFTQLLKKKYVDILISRISNGFEDS